MNRSCENCTLKSKFTEIKDALRCLDWYTWPMVPMLFELAFFESTPNSNETQRILPASMQNPSIFPKLHNSKKSARKNQSSEAGRLYSCSLRVVRPKRTWRINKSSSQATHPFSWQRIIKWITTEKEQHKVLFFRRGSIKSESGHWFRITQQDSDNLIREVSVSSIIFIHLPLLHTQWMMQLDQWRKPINGVKRRFHRNCPWKLDEVNRWTTSHTFCVDARRAVGSCSLSQPPVQNFLVPLKCQFVCLSVCLFNQKMPHHQHPRLLKSFFICVKKIRENINHKSETATKMMQPAISQLLFVCPTSNDMNVPNWNVPMTPSGLILQLCPGAAKRHDVGSECGWHLEWNHCDAASQSMKSYTRSCT